MKIFIIKMFIKTNPRCSIEFATGYENMQDAIKDATENLKNTEFEIYSEDFFNELNK